MFSLVKNVVVDVATEVRRRRAWKRVKGLYAVTTRTSAMKMANCTAIVGGVTFSDAMDFAVTRDGLVVKPSDIGSVGIGIPWNEIDVSRLQYHSDSWVQLGDRAQIRLPSEDGTRLLELISSRDDRAIA